MFIPEQPLVTTVRDDMVNHRCGGDEAFLQALHTQRIVPQIAVAGSTPFAIVSALRSISAHAVG